MFRALAAAGALIVGTIGGARADAPVPTYKLIEPSLVPLLVDGVSATVSNVIYLNNCRPDGCKVFPGSDNSATGSSSVPDQSSTVRPFELSDTVWNDVVQCVRDTYAPFSVQIVTERPSTGAYHMAIVAGRPGDIGLENNVGGVSPFTCGFISRSISYSFANMFKSVDQICWTIAQETAHSWGLDHKYDNRDPMTYLPTGPARKAFQDEDGPCGEFSERPCMCGGSTMNSYQDILATFGGGTSTPPAATETCVDGRCVDNGLSPPDGDDGGGCSTDGDPESALLVGLMVAGLARLRRRR